MEAPAGLSSEEWRSVPLLERSNVNYNTVHLRFGLQGESTANLHVASCLFVRAPLGEEQQDGSKEQVMRPYTPVSAPNEKGHFDLMVKVRSLPIKHSSKASPGWDAVWVHSKDTARCQCYCNWLVNKVQWADRLSIHAGNLQYSFSAASQHPGLHRCMRRAQ